MRETLAVSCLLLLAACASAERNAKGDSPAHAACRRVLIEQVAAWNRGDLEGFAAGYLESEDLVFTGKSGTTTGFDGLLERYRQSYPDTATMGRLRFLELHFEDLSPDEVLARGGWELTRANDRPHGRFVLVLREVSPDTWRVVLDYTTSLGS